MGFDPNVLNELLTIFKNELTEQTQLLINSLLALEEAEILPEARAQAVTTILRAAHNIKGTARSLGIEDIGNVAHEIETLFAHIKNNAEKMPPTLINSGLALVEKMLPALQLFIDEKFGVVVEPQPKQESVRIALGNIDTISTLMEELQINKIALDDHYTELNHLSQRVQQFEKTWKKILPIIKKEHLDSVDNWVEIKNTTDNLQKDMRQQINTLSIVTNALQEEVHTLRLLPATTLLSSVPLYVRNLAQELQKKINISIRGDEVLMDKIILENLRDPLQHLLRNAIDHGIETPAVRLALGKSEVGNIYIEISEENGLVHIRVEDDGAGMDIKQIAAVAVKKSLLPAETLSRMSDADIMALVFYPEFSTKEVITTLSGRGVGLDVVKSNIESINGRVTVHSALGKGTTFDLYLPFTLASERGLLVTVGNQCVVLPINAIQRVLTLRADDVLLVEGSEAIVFEQKSIPLRSLAAVLGIENAALRSAAKFTVVLLTKNAQTIALLVNDVIGEREIVIKPLLAPLHEVRGVAGGTLSGNQVMLVLDPADIITQALQNPMQAIVLPLPATAATVPHILVVDDSITTRTLEKSILESKNYQVTIAVNGQEAWDLLQQQHFALVITDVAMPLMDGFALTDKIKKTTTLQHIPVIIVTSLGSDNEKKQGMAAGADAYVIKNEFESGALLTIVEQLL